MIFIVFLGFLWDVSLKFDNTDLTFDGSHSHLGVQFDKNAKWSGHIKEIYLSVTKKFSALGGKFG